MQKREILREISKKTNFTIENCETAYDAFMEVIVEAMQADEGKVTFSGVGTLNRKIRKARMCHNPQTGGKVSVPERVTYTFKIAPKIKEMLNNK